MLGGAKFLRCLHSRTMRARTFGSAEEKRKRRRHSGTSGHPPRFDSMTKYSRAQPDGLEVALAIHLGIYCAAAACFGLGFYALLQPSRYPNPGLSAYKAPSAMVVTYMPSMRNSRDPAPFTTVAAETAKPETAGRAKAADAQKHAQEATAEAPRRQRAASAPKAKREPWARYAEQPTFGGHRPWF